MLFMLSGDTLHIQYAAMANQRHFGRFVSAAGKGSLNLDRWQVWGLDNGAFSGFNKDRFYAYLKTLLPFKATCKFVIAPDVPFQWKATLELFPKWQPMIKNLGFPVALATQDGATVKNIDWNAIDAIFIGGSTEWKRSEHNSPMFPDDLSETEKIIREAKRRNMWVHMGRQANSRKQLWQAFRMGADSVDGTSECYAPDKQFRWISQSMWEINNVKTALNNGGYHNQFTISTTK